MLKFVKTAVITGLQNFEWTVLGVEISLEAEISVTERFLPILSKNRIKVFSKNHQ
jgi:hypothetical protein